jgi:hypothetical protein
VRGPATEARIRKDLLQSHGSTQTARRRRNLIELIADCGPIGSCPSSIVGERRPPSDLGHAYDNPRTGENGNSAQDAQSVARGRGATRPRDGRPVARSADQRRLLSKAATSRPPSTLAMAVPQAILPRQIGRPQTTLPHVALEGGIGRAGMQRTRRGGNWPNLCPAG